VYGAVDYSSLVKETFDTCLQVKPKDKVWIQCWDHTLGIAKAFAFECSLRACPCLLSVRYEDAWLQSVLHASKEHLKSITPQEESALKRTDIFIFTMGPRNPIPWSSISKEKRGEVSVWLDTRYDKSTYARKWARVAKAHKVKMLAIEATLATPQRAKAQGLNHEAWRNVMFRGCIVDHKAISRRAKALTMLMAGEGSIRVTTRAGTQLDFELDSRPVGISDGISTEEIVEKGRLVFLPAGTIEVSVNEESAQGRIVYDTSVKLGNEMVQNLVIDLKDGRIQRYSATRGSDSLGRYLRTGGKEAGEFSFFGFGLNPNLRYGFTQDDKVLGSLTLGFGNNVSMDGKNSATDQWWASITGATVEVNGTTLMSEGNLPNR
jgi:leucyl aminopeptidase (aminopeptidase T)